MADETEEKRNILETMKLILSERRRHCDNVRWARLVKADEGVNVRNEAVIARQELGNKSTQQMLEISEQTLQWSLNVR